MDLKEIMEQKVFVVVGDTIKEEKYAYKIKRQLIEYGYRTYGVGKELETFEEISEEIDIIDLCINPVRGLEYIKSCRKSYKCVVIQPGAESEELLEYLKKNNILYLEGCLLVGISLYGKKSN